MGSILCARFKERLITLGTQRRDVVTTAGLEPFGIDVRQRHVRALVGLLRTVFHGPAHAEVCEGVFVVVLDFEVFVSWRTDYLLVVKGGSRPYRFVDVSGMNTKNYECILTIDSARVVVFVPRPAFFLPDRVLDPFLRRVS